jgi:lysophospholipase L1-like esterase
VEDVSGGWERGPHDEGEGNETPLTVYGERAQPLDLHWSIELDDCPPGTGIPMKSDSWTGKLTLVVGATLVGLGLLGATGEFVVRYRERHRSTVPGTMPLLFYRHSRLRHALVRKYDYFGWVHIDREGFRGREVTAEKQREVLRIMVVGSSTTFDPQVTSDSATWPARLEGWLMRLSPRRKVEVINAGVPGYYVIDNVIRLEIELHQYKPDLIILYEGHNDLFGALQQGKGDADSPSSRPGEMPAVTPWQRWLSDHSLFYTKLQGRLKVIELPRRAGAGPGARTGASVEALLNKGANNFTRHLTVFLAVARALGLRVVLPELVHVSGVGATEERDPAIREEWQRAVPFARPENVLSGYVRYRDALRRVAEQNEVSWIPTASFDLAGPKWYAPGDPIHFNDRGADRFAEQMARALLAAGVLPQ